jgi:trigger factor
MKREVRQRCGFGCVICGCPIYDYEHVVDYSVVREHEAANLTLLCPNHHAEKTRGLLAREVIQAANEVPFNRQSGHSAPFHLRYVGQNPVLVLGNVSVEVERVERGVDAIVIDGVSLVGFRFDDGECLLQMRLFDKDDQEVLTVVDNELTYMVDTPDAWDFEFVSGELTVRSAPREILLGIRFEPPRTVVISRGNLFYRGVEIQIWPYGIAVVNFANLFAGFTATFQGFGLEDGAPIFLGFGDIPANRFAAKRWPEIPRDGFDRQAHLDHIKVGRQLAESILGPADEKDDD